MTYQTVKISSDSALAAPSIVEFRRGNMIVTRALIPATHTHARVTYFSDNIDGRSYGSYPTKQQAIDALPMPN